MYAVNVADLSAIIGPENRRTAEGFVVRMLFAPVIQSKQVVDAEPGRIDGAAVLLECEDERAEAIVAVIRKKLEKHKLRCYKGSRKTWRRI